MPPPPSDPQARPRPLGIASNHGSLLHSLPMPRAWKLTPSLHFLLSSGALLFAAGLGLSVQYVLSLLPGAFLYRSLAVRTTQSAPHRTASFGLATLASRASSLTARLSCPCFSRLSRSPLYFSCLSLAVSDDTESSCNALCYASTCTCTCTPYIDLSHLPACHRLSKSKRYGWAEETASHFPETDKETFE